MLLACAGDKHLYTVLQPYIAGLVTDGWHAAVQLPASCVSISTHAWLKVCRGCAGDKHLYTVLEQQQAQIAQGNLMGSDHTYVIPQAASGAGAAERRPQGGAAKRQVPFLQLSCCPCVPLLCLFFLSFFPPLMLWKEDHRVVQLRGKCPSCYCLPAPVYRCYAVACVTSSFYGL